MPRFAPICVLAAALTSASVAPARDDLDLKKVFEKNLKAAEAGDAAAMYRVG
jgi:hypothetical protein